MKCIKCDFSCSEEKINENFYQSKAFKSGYESTCKTCRKTQSKAFRIEYKKKHGIVTKTKEEQIEILKAANKKRIEERKNRVLTQEEIDKRDLKKFYGSTYYKRGMHKKKDNYEKQVKKESFEKEQCKQFIKELTKDCNEPPKVISYLQDIFNKIRNEHIPSIQSVEHEQNEERPLTQLEIDMRDLRNYYGPNWKKIVGWDD